MSMIEVKNVTKSFGDLTVLKDFSVDFNQEGVTVLLGPSGTGKSTLLRCINALETIDSGDIIVNGLSVKEKKESAADTSGLRNGLPENCAVSTFKCHAEPDHESGETLEDEQKGSRGESQFLPEKGRPGI